MISIGIPTREYRRFLCFSSILLGIAVGIAPRLLGLAKRVIREKTGNFLNFSIFRLKVGFDHIYCTIGTQTCTVILTCAKTHENPWFIGCRGNLKAFWGPHSEKIRPPEKFRKTGWKGRTFRDFRFFGPKHDFSPTVHAQKIWHGGFGCISGENGRKSSIWGGFMLQGGQNVGKSVFRKSLEKSGKKSLFFWIFDFFAPYRVFGPAGWV